MPANDHTTSAGRHQTPVIGQSFGRLTVVTPPFSARKNDGSSRRYVRCRCSCGAETEVAVGYLFRGLTRSCGCISTDRIVAFNRIHGESKSRLHGIWRGMIQRCTNPRKRSYKDYGAKGINLCDDWKDFRNFRDWALANGYRDDLTIERIRLDEDYSPENCTWIPHSEQSRHRTTSRYITAFGETKILADWVRDPRCVVSRMQLVRRLEKYDPETALTMPVIPPSPPSRSSRVAADRK